MTIFILPAGGFFSLGVIIAIVGKISKRKPKDISCSGCPNKASCKFAEGDDVSEEAVAEK